MHSVGNHGGGVDSVSHGSVDGVSHLGSGVDGVGHGSVDERGVVGSVVDRGNRVDGDDSGLADWDGSVGSDGGLDLRETLGVVGLAHRGVSGTKSLGLGQSPHFSMSGGDRLVGGLTSSDGVVEEGGVVGTEDGSGGEGGGEGEEGEADKGLE